jgi:hypothetical protein
LIGSGLVGIEGGIIGGGSGGENEYDGDTGTPPVFRERNEGKENEADNKEDRE